MFVAKAKKLSYYINALTIALMYYPAIVQRADLLLEEMQDTNENNQDELINKLP